MSYNPLKLKGYETLVGGIFKMVTDAMRFDGNNKTWVSEGRQDISVIHITAEINGVLYSGNCCLSIFDLVTHISAHNTLYERVCYKLNPSTSCWELFDAKVLVPTTVRSNKNGILIRE